MYMHMYGKTSNLAVTNTMQCIKSSSAYKTCRCYACYHVGSATKIFKYVAMCRDLEVLYGVSTFVLNVKQWIYGSKVCYFKCLSRIMCT
jgi:hypothetical protein